ncbi:type II secretion system F family protein [Vibrio rotiferianus]|uniref:type II secretion system F family protein n=1 Tax=Vibrio rotiferianus TaxID=190895 RepID=UPI0005EE6B3E|nr:type II secretion system F family protein [Vibrio rotiferianus]
MISSKELPNILHLMSKFIDAGFDTASMLEYTGRSYPKYKVAFDKVAKECRSGSALGQALRAVELFAVKDIDVIERGEISGHLSKVIGEMAEIKKDLNGFSSEIKQGLMQPVVTILFALSFFPYVLYANADQTGNKYLLGFAEFVERVSSIVPYLEFVYPVSLFLLVGWIYYSKVAKSFIFSAFMHIPFVSKVLIDWQISNWSSLASLALKSSVGIKETVDMLSDTLSPDLDAALKKLNDVSINEGWERALDQDAWDEGDERFVLPNVFLGFLRAGWAQGSLDVRLADVSEIIRDDAKTAISRISNVIFFLVLGIAGAIVLMVMAAVMLTQYESMGGFV